LADRWDSSAWRIAKLDAAVATIAGATVALGHTEALAGALDQLDDAITEARVLGRAQQQGWRPGDDRQVPQRLDPHPSTAHRHDCLQHLCQAGRPMHRHDRNESGN
jgi:hypothetical protein